VFSAARIDGLFDGLIATITVARRSHIPKVTSKAPPPGHKHRGRAGRGNCAGLRTLISVSPGLATDARSSKTPTGRMFQRSSLAWHQYRHVPGQQKSIFVCETIAWCRVLRGGTAFVGECAGVVGTSDHCAPQPGSATFVGRSARASRCSRNEATDARTKLPKRRAPANDLTVNEGDCCSYAMTEVPRSNECVVTARSASQTPEGPL
jgi:hypothetical protein